MFLLLGCSLAVKGTINFAVLDIKSEILVHSKFVSHRILWWDVKLFDDSALLHFFLLIFILNGFLLVGIEFLWLDCASSAMISGEHWV